MLNGKHIILAVTGGIAAYKAAFLVRLFIKQGAIVKCIMTDDAKAFVTPLTLSTLSNQPVEIGLTDNNSWTNHVELALWADLMVVAPVTANTLSKMADGHCDNLVLVTYLSAKCPVFIAPAMDLDMYAHPSTQQNLNLLESYGHHIIPAEKGFLASGLEGFGRMAEPETIVNCIHDFLKKDLPLFGKTVLVSAGPTYERIDPVRFIGNFSSGKMGFEIAHAALALGAHVILVCGPCHLSCDSNIKRINIESAQDMLDAMTSVYDQSDIVIMAAAVADYKPATIANQKIKKKDDEFHLTLQKTTDVLHYLGQHKRHQILIGFALETENELANAQGKLERKNLDAIILNSLNHPDAGFQKDTNRITIVQKNGQFEYPSKSKKDVANDILQFIIHQL